MSDQHCGAGNAPCFGINTNAVSPGFDHAQAFARDALEVDRIVELGDALLQLCVAVFEFGRLLFELRQLAALIEQGSQVGRGPG